MCVKLKKKELREHKRAHTSEHMDLLLQKVSDLRIANKDLKRQLHATTGQVCTFSGESRTGQMSYKMQRIINVKPSTVKVSTQDIQDTNYVLCLSQTTPKKEVMSFMSAFHCK